MIVSASRPHAGSTFMMPPRAGGVHISVATAGRSPVEKAAHAQSTMAWTWLLVVVHDLRDAGYSAGTPSGAHAMIHLGEKGRSYP